MIPEGRDGITRRISPANSRLRFRNSCILGSLEGVLETFGLRLSRVIRSSMP